MKRQNLSKLRGFTLVELLTVITIIVILIGLLIGLMDWMFSKILIDLFGRVFG